MTSEEVRSITREMVRAARNAAAGTAEIGMRPEAQPRGKAQGKNKSAPAGPRDHIYITLNDASRLQDVEHALDLVATAHELSKLDAAVEPRAPGLTRFDYGLGRHRTHSILIATPDPRRRARAAGPGPRLAILIDDLGYDRAAAHALFALPYPFTVAVLPNLSASADLAEEAHRLGCQVMLHLPMQSINGEAKSEPNELYPGMDPGEVRMIVARMLDSVPHAVGANNHQGSRATLDPELMSAVMEALKEREVFFVDSRTAGGSVAYTAARRAGLPATYRTVFLDDTPTREFVEQQLVLAERQAREQGWALAIGHPHPTTLEALSAQLPLLEQRGVRLVFVSDLITK
ncbi:MAG TPA: divergent polysaccharide deacetylase family protein [Candidatus Acidoferrales bacterium]